MYQLCTPERGGGGGKTPEVREGEGIKVAPRLYWAILSIRFQKKFFCVAWGGGMGGGGGGEGGGGGVGGGFGGGWGEKRHPGEEKTDPTLMSIKNIGWVAVRYDGRSPRNGTQPGRRARI